MNTMSTLGALKTGPPGCTGERGCGGGERDAREVSPGRGGPYRPCKESGSLAAGQ